MHLGAETTKGEKKKTKKEKSRKKKETTKRGADGTVADIDSNRNKKSKSTWL